MDRPPLITALLSPACYPHACSKIELIETHISWVILTGKYAYKIKKPLNLGFLNFASLDKRHHYCKEELRLNQRLAPQLYIDVVAIYYNGPQLSIVEAHPEAVEFAVRMHQFSQQQMLTSCLHRHTIETRHIKQLAYDIAHFHLTHNQQQNNPHHGNINSPLHAIEDNFHHLTQCLPNIDLNQLHQDLHEKCQSLRPLMTQRLQQGFVRECHGDMHLGNMVMLDDHITLFDCIEFNPDFFWIDVMSDIAFLLMDLQHRNYPEWANQLLNHYLSKTGDYAGLPLLSLYQSYRAMVRAKVTAILLQQHNNPEEQYTALESVNAYLKLAQQFIRPSRGALIITHGLSGSGKSYLCQQLSPQLNAIHLRSDVERKRIFSINPEIETHTALSQQHYSPQAKQVVYRHLLAISSLLIEHGFTVLVDATFIDHEPRDHFQQLAADKGCPFIILQLDAPSQQLRHNIHQRQRHSLDPSDADLSVLRKQQQHYQSLPAECSSLIQHHWGDEIKQTLHAIRQKLSNHSKQIELQGR